MCHPSISISPMWSGQLAGVLLINMTIYCHLVVIEMNGNIRLKSDIMLTLPVNTFKTTKLG